MTDYVLVATGTQMAGALVLVLLLVYFARTEERPYLELWAWSWLAFAAYAGLATASRFAVVEWPPADPRRVALTVLSLTAGFTQPVLVIAGTLELSRRMPLSRRRLVPALAGAPVLAVILTLLFIGDPGASDLRYYARVGVRGLLAAAAFAAAGVAFGIRHRHTSRLGSRCLPPPWSATAPVNWQRCSSACRWALGSPRRR
ncbi:MAG TPA: hypothetical protein VNT81_09565 [Vicinamibacterales bacterium]|nr:hypothetical protein [Vicinamibacterales bacterium]